MLPRRLAFIVAVCLSVLASPAFVSAAQAAPVADQSLQTTFYNDVRDKRYDAALAAGAVYRKHHPADDRFALDYAYALINAHRTAEATALLERLKTSHVATVRTAALRQLAAQATPPPVAAAPVIAPVPSPFTHAYELLAGGDVEAARDAFRATLQDHPDDAAAWQQLATIEFSLKERDGMIDALEHYTALAPSDERGKLQLAYALFDAHRDVQARKLLVDLTHSTNPETADTARRQLAASLGTGGGRVNRLDVFGYALNDSRFHDAFYGLDAHYKLAPTRIEPYLAFHLSSDAKSSTVPASQVLNDDVAILSAGVRTALTPNLYAYIEGGQASSLLTGHAQSDLRYGLLLSQRLGAGGFKSQTQIDASVTHYSRYINTIAYATAINDFFIGSKVVRGIVGTNLALDTSRAFYNNTAEVIAGVQARHGPFTLRLFATGGYYLGRGIDVPAQRTYSSIRPELIFGFSR